MNFITFSYFQVPEAFSMLIDTVENALKHAIIEEEKIPFETVTNFDEIASDIKSKLGELRDTPLRMENPIIYHLDVGKLCYICIISVRTFLCRRRCVS